MIVIPSENLEMPQTKISSGVHTFPAPGVTLTYTVKGSGPLLFIQAAGWGISSRYLQIGLATLEEHFTLIYPEPRASGNSARPDNEDDMGTSDMADDIERLRVHLQLDQIDLVGHSNGGTIALAYAERYPTAVRKLILVTHWLAGYDDSAEWKRFLEERRERPAYAKALAAFKATADRAPDAPPLSDDEWYKNLVDSLSFYVGDVQNHYPIFVEAMGVPSRWVGKMQSAADKKKPLELYAGLDKVTAKTLCIGCSEDPVCSENASRVTAEGIPGAKLVVVREVGHFPWIEQPDEFFPAIRDFIEP